MNILPTYYTPDTRLRLQIAGAPFEVVVIRAFTPSTQSQVLLVRPAHQCSSLPPSFVLKVYDPRLDVHRECKSYPHPWTYGAEASAATKRTSDRNVDFSYHNKPSDEGDIDDDGAEIMQDADERKADWEEWYYQVAVRQHHQESTSYDLLAALQGDTIPRYLGSGSLVLSSFNRAISPPVLLLEYIPDAKTLGDVDPSTIVDVEGLVHTLIGAVRSFGDNGVVHMDLNQGNILFTPGDRPTRAVIVDFGQSDHREDESDLEWYDVVYCNSDEPAMTSILSHYLKYPRNVCRVTPYLPPAAKVD
ncbi:hypothetical protein FIBSPDRAFT_1035878 [Athelia psychrophila]|uniref:Protein kinase domain-containing protein n=1 Tax=Athelia psychrophila TaxID=1759441 RepID=A0A166WPA7_9AGAM|nr:hypothetical protein FIBSPDRAFT_1035878 [Fibularhizoctonia sp. CBS 109695]